MSNQNCWEILGFQSTQELEAQEWPMAMNDQEWPTRMTHEFDPWEWPTWMTHENDPRDPRELRDLAHSLVNCCFSQNITIQFNSLMHLTSYGNLYR